MATCPSTTKKFHCVPVIMVIAIDKVSKYGIIYLYILRRLPALTEFLLYVGS